MTAWPQGTPPACEDRAFMRAHYAECLAGMRHPLAFRIIDGTLHLLVHKPRWLTRLQQWAGLPKHRCHS